MSRDRHLNSGVTSVSKSHVQQINYNLTSNCYGGYVGCGYWVAGCSGINLLALPLMAVLFQGGQFTAEDVWASSLALMGYAAALPAFMLVKVLVPAFLPVKILKRQLKLPCGRYW